MGNKYSENAELLRALADVNRLRIVDMLSADKLCACNILEKLDITQPTLSHHMKILCDSGLVFGQKEGKWVYYTLVEEKVIEFKDFLHTITINKESIS